MNILVPVVESPFEEREEKVSSFLWLPLPHMLLHILDEKNAPTFFHHMQKEQTHNTKEVVLKLLLGFNWMSGKQLTTGWLADQRTKIINFVFNYYYIYHVCFTFYSEYQNENKQMANPRWQHFIHKLQFCLAPRYSQKMLTVSKRFWHQERKCIVCQKK